MKAKLNKGRIMRNAWKQFKGHFNIKTFGQCLSDSWAKAKKVLKQIAKVYKNSTMYMGCHYMTSKERYDRTMRCPSKGSRMAKCERITSNMYNSIKA